MSLLKLSTIPNTGVQAISYAYFGLGTGPVHISYVGCSGTEQELLDCSYSGFDNTYCSHSYDAGVRCQSELRFIVRLDCTMTTSHVCSLKQHMCNW